MDLTYCELREKDVVNMVDGRKLGRVIDLIFTVCGKLIGLIVPGEHRMLRALSRDDSIFIPWKCIVKIGEDVILVQLGHNKIEEEHESHNEEKSAFHN